MKYELTTIVADEGTTNPAPELIAAQGGSIVREDEIGARKFAYPIGKRTNGVYTRFVIELDPSKTQALDAALRHDGTIIRHLLVIEPRESIAPAPRKVEMSDEQIAAIGDVKEMQAAEEKAKAKKESAPLETEIEKSTEDSTVEETPAPTVTVEEDVEEEAPAADEQPTEDVTVTDQAAIKNDSKVDEATRQAALDEKLKSILGK